MPTYHVLNIGAGVQSTALYLLARAGRFRFDQVVFADTGEEPDAVYRHLEYPLIEMGWSRTDCVAYLREQLPYEVPKSSCVFCPYRTNASWTRLTHSDPAGWQRAVEIDTALRTEGSLVTRGFRQKLYLHRSCQPLATINWSVLAPQTLDPMTTGECEGRCGV